MERTCKYCKWWSFILYDDDYDDGMCESEYLRTEGLLDDRGLFAPAAVDIYTGPDFGCIHWEIKK